MTWVANAKPTTKTITIGQPARDVSVSYWTKTKSIFDDLSGPRNTRYYERNMAIVGGQLFAVDGSNLTTGVWTGTAWEYLVDKARGQALCDAGEIDAVATDGRRAWAVARTGQVYEWGGETWTKLGDGGPEFAKGRRFFRLAWDGARERLVLWGGDNGNRAANDTLFFEKGAWRKSKKSGTKLSERKHDNYFVYEDTVRGGIVRVGSEAVSFLDGDAWTPLSLAPPPFVTAAPGGYREYFVAAHDPASKTTHWIDPIVGDVYREGGEIERSIGEPVGMCSNTFLVANGAYFSARDFATENHRDWMFVWDRDKRRLYGVCSGSAPNVTWCDLT